MRNLLLCLSLLLGCGILANAAELIVKSQAAGNIVTAGTPLHFTVTGARDEVRYQVKDYFGNAVADGTALLHNGTAPFTVTSLQPGYYELECVSGDARVTTSIGVVMDRGNAPLPSNGHIGVDSAAGWLVTPSDLPAYVNIIRLAGIPWVRERTSWGEIEQQPGQFTWNVPGRAYEELANLYTAAGISVQQNWGPDSPGWTLKNGVSARCPEDMRTIYRFAKAMAQHYSGRYKSWEICNEPDISQFWDDISDRYAGYIKAAYLGTKAGDPKTKAFPGALCVGYSIFGHHAAESLGGYTDGFGWHIYQPPARFTDVFNGYEPIRKAGEMLGKPVRLTEVGIKLETIPGSRYMGQENQQKQCRFIPQFAANALKVGCEKSFFFVMPDYIEGTGQFGLLHGDLTPNPALVAISAAANILGQATYLGQYPVQDSHATAYAFSTPKGNVLVAWADQPATLRIPTEKDLLHMANIFGAALPPIMMQNGEITMNVGPDAVYLLDTGNALTKDLINKPAAAKPAPAVSKPSPVVIVGHDDRTLEHDIDSDVYLLSAKETQKADAPKQVTYLVDVYNFSEKTANAGTVKVTVPKGWRVTPSQQAVKLAPMDRKVLTFTLTLPPITEMGPYKVTATAKFGNERVLPTASYFDVSAKDLTPSAHQPLSWLDASTLWTPFDGTTGKASISHPDANSTKLTMHWTGEAPHTVYATLTFPQPVDVSKFPAFALNYKLSHKLENGYLHIRLHEASGAIYGAYWLSETATTSTHYVFFFKDQFWLPTSTIDPNKHLDLDKITAISIGGEFTAPTDLDIDLSDIELVDFPKANK